MVVGMGVIDLEVEFASNKKNQYSEEEPDSCSINRSDLIVINEGLRSIMSHNQGNEIWISFDSRSYTQYLANWHKMRYNVAVTIL